MLLNLLNKLEQTTSRNEKVAIIVDALSGVNGNSVYDMFQYALNPFYNYGCKNVEIGDDSNSQQVLMDSFTKGLLDELRTLTHSYATYDCIGRLMASLSKNDQIVAKRIILKDLRCGVQIATVNTAIKKVGKYETIPDYPCMLTMAYDEKAFNKLDFENDTILCQEKCDGMRFNAIVHFGIQASVEFRGRSGKPISIPNVEFAKELIDIANVDSTFKQYDGVVLDGELLVCRNGSILDRKTGNGILNKAVRGTITKEEAEDIVCVLWDVIDLESFKVGKQTDCEENYYKERFNKLTHLYNLLEEEKGYVKHISLVDTIYPKDKGEVVEMFEKMLSEGKEGVIVKSGKNVWRDARVNDQIKFKAEMDCDLKVVEVVEGTGRFENSLGAILCESSDGKVVVSVGSGYSDEQRKSLWLSKDSIIGKIVTVTYNAKISDKKRETDSLFLPRFVELREDKTEADSSDKIK